MPSNVTRISRLIEGSNRPLHIGISHASLLTHYAEKSDSSKYAQLNADTSRLYFPGDNIVASILLDSRGFPELDALEVQFIGEVHTFGYSQLAGSGASASAGGGAQLQLEKQVFLSCSAKIQLPSMQCEAPAGSIALSQHSKEEPMLFDVATRLPLYLVGGKEIAQRLALPCVFHDGTTGKPAAFVTYHWKVVTSRKSSFKSRERLYKPLMVMSMPLKQVYPDPFLFQKLSYPPHHLMNSYGMYREVKKYMIKTAALTELELAVPSMDAWPIFRPVPVIIRLSVRAKTPSDLLEPRQFTLPLLPSQEVVSAAEQAGAPLFYIRRYRSTQIHMSTSEIVRERCPCKCDWDLGHLNNGITQQVNGRGFEGGREGSTPIADERAKAGLSHGWTWPARSDPRSESTYFSTPVAPFRKQALATLLPGSSNSPPDEKLLQAFEYVSTCTLFAKVYLAAHPSVKVNNLIVSNELGFTWSMEGARNKIDATLGNVDVNLATDARQVAGIPQDDLIKAISTPELLSDQSILFYALDQGPASLLPPPFAGHERPPRYSDPLPSLAI